MVWFRQMFTLGQTMAKKLRRGTTAIEYTLVAALVIGVILLAVSALGEHTSRAAKILGGTPDRAVAASPTTTTAAGGSLLAQPADGRATWSAAGHILQLVLATGLVIGIALQAFLSARKIRQPKSEVAGSPEKADPLDRLFNKRQDMLKDLSQIIEAHHLSELKVGQVMTNNLTVVGKSTSVKELERLLHTERRHHILVTGDNDQLAGIVSDRDLSRRGGDSAAEVMTSKVTYATPDTDLSVAATTMINQGISALPVVADGKLSGILTTTDLTLVLQCILLLAKREDSLVNC